jgi:glycosyltransferase involved in cell wall biosynthesis
VPAPLASVAVCTRNRGHVLDACLASLATQTIAARSVEVIVVDNGATDETPSVVQQWHARIGNLRYISEPTPGLSRARNRALDAAAGAIVAFLDDDARATPSWLAQLLRVYEDDDVAAAGGPVQLAWPSGRPSWMSADIEGWYTGLDLGPSQRNLTDGEELFGCNMSVRREAARRAGGFNVSLGRVGRRLRSGEDWHLLDMVRRAGGALVYIPDAIVVHEVLPERLSLRWLLRRTYEQGRTDALLTRAEAPAKVLWSEARDTSLSALRLLAGEARRWVRGRPFTEVVVALTRRTRQIGYARECTRLALAAVRSRASEDR